MVNISLKFHLKSFYNFLSYFSNRQSNKQMPDVTYPPLVEVMRLVDDVTDTI